ncbi:DUF4839 domain-containing protein [Globicatella sulfidifaciens]
MWYKDEELLINNLHHDEACDKKISLLKGRKLMKKYFYLFLSLVSILFIVGCEAEKEEVNDENLASYQVYLDVDFKANLFLDKYNVNVYIDEKEIGHIEHGEYFTLLLNDIKEGNHEIRFESNEDTSVFGEHIFNVEEDTTLSLSIKAERKKVLLENINIEKGVNESGLAMPDLKNTQLDIALEQLKTAGFINVSYDSEGGESIWDDSNWIVNQQNIDVGEKIDKNTKIILSAIKYNTYINESYKDLTLKVVLSKAEQEQFTKFEYVLENKELSDDEIANKLEDWRVLEAEPITADQKTLKVILAYQGEVSMPNLIGMNIDEVKQELSKNFINNYEEKFPDNNSYRSSLDYVVKEQSINPEVKFNASDKLTVTYKTINEYNFENVTEATETKEEIKPLTYNNNKDFAYILENDDLEAKRNFVEKYKGQIVEFEGNISYLNLHGSSKTRYDYLIYPWNFSELTSKGAGFQFRDKSPMELARIWSNAPDYIEIGMNIHIVARIEEFTSGELIILDPISISHR